VVLAKFGMKVLSAKSLLRYLLLDSEYWRDEHRTAVQAYRRETGWRATWMSASLLTDRILCEHGECQPPAQGAFHRRRDAMIAAVGVCATC